MNVPELQRTMEEPWFQLIVKYIRRLFNLIYIIQVIKFCTNIEEMRQEMMRAEIADEMMEEGWLLIALNSP